MSSPETETTAAAPEETEAAPRPSPAAAVLDALTVELGDAVVGSEIHAEDLWVRVRADAWRRTAEACRSLGFEYFCFLSGIDWMPHTWPNPAHQGEESATEESSDGGDGPETEAEDGADARQGWQTGYAGGDTRFQVLARLHSLERKLGIILKADLDDDEPRVETWSSIYAGADWHERETWEMYGFDFVGHPNLAHIYLPTEFEGFPLRKDFPLLAREVKPWPGLVDPEPMPGDAEAGDGVGSDEDSGEDGDGDQ